MSERFTDAGWTGGQYSLLRAFAGAAIVVREAAHVLGAAPAELALRAVAIALAASFAAGFRERAVSYALSPTLIALGFTADQTRPSDSHWIALAVLLHWATPAAPYGSLDARGRIDPRGEWCFPRWIRAAALVGLVGALTTLASGHGEPWIALAWFAALAASPAWIAPSRAKSVEHVFYDGTCGVCHAWVRFALAEARDGSRLRFAPLAGGTAAREIGAQRLASLPDSVVLRADSGGLLVRSEAVVHLLSRLGGAWGAIGAALSIVPRPLRDAAYDALARTRKSLARAPSSACRLLPRDLAERMDP